jgi:hypothetical protein
VSEVLQLINISFLFSSHVIQCHFLLFTFEVPSDADWLVTEDPSVRPLVEVVSMYVLHGLKLV